MQQFICIFLLQLHNKQEVNPFSPKPRSVEHQSCGVQGTIYFGKPDRNFNQRFTKLRDFRYEVQRILSGPNVKVYSNDTLTLI